MTAEDSKRKLAAILSADVKGYSRLMSLDEEATVKTLKQHRVTISGLVSEHIVARFLCLFLDLS